MKNLLLTILCAISLSVYAQNVEPVSMVSYEQTFLDDEGTLALKNNTEEQIHNVAFRITYQDMAGNDLDYEEYTRRVEIEPGMTRKIDIPGYESDRQYEYYKTVRSSGSYPTFKVKYECVGYNKEETKVQETSAESEDSDFSEAAGAATGMIVGIIIVAMLLISISVGLYVMVAVIAQKYERNVILWLVLSFVASPLLILIILLCIGKEGEKPTRERY